MANVFLCSYQTKTLTHTQNGEFLGTKNTSDIIRVSVRVVSCYRCVIFGDSKNAPTEVMAFCTQRYTKFYFGR